MSDFYAFDEALGARYTDPVPRPEPKPFVAHRYAIRHDGSCEKLSDLAFPMLRVTSRDGFLDLINEWNQGAMMEWSERDYHVLYVAA